VSNVPAGGDDPVIAVAGPAGDDVPVIAIDGPAASGKGTIAAGVAAALGFHYLDSGALYRLVALQALEHALDPGDECALAEQARSLRATFTADRIHLDGRDVTELIRGEAVSKMASAVAIHPAVREGLLARQRAFRQEPGLVADGRDMGSVVFPDATIKVFLTASAEERARRRYKQLIAKGISVTIDGLLRDIRERDARDATRVAAPLAAAPGAALLDTTNLSIAAATDTVLAMYAGRAAAAADGGRPSP
jgi:cytidylate kinase